MSTPSAEAGALSRSLLGAALARSAEANELERRLAGLDPAALDGDPARLAFWLNLYNALLLRELERRRPSGSVLRNRGMFSSAPLRVGAYAYSLDLIEHGLLRLNARPPYRLRRLLRSGDPRRAAGPSRLDPRVHFALNCGAVSCPPIRAYEEAGVDRELELATRAYVRAESALDRERGKLRLPYLMRLYRRDFGDPAAFASAHLEPADADWIRERRPAITFGRFDWSLAER